MQNKSASDKDLLIIERSLGRPPRALIDIAARCICGNPAVVRCKPLLDNDTPFPTHYYLVLSTFIKKVSSLESVGVMKELNEKIKTDKSFREKYIQAHLSYIRDREAFGKVSQIADFSAGGAPGYIKCLHSHLAHTLAVGKGINPVGDFLLKTGDFDLSVCECIIPYNSFPTRKAIIDCGTNTIRLLIADVYNGDNPYLEDVIERQMVINRLGYRLDKTANLDKSSLEKTFEACKQFKAKIDKCNPEKVIFIATSAARDAKNSDELINGVEKILGIKPKIINGETEALYSFLGVISSVKKKLTNLSVVIDIGGGSTEIALGGSALASAYSMQAGSIRVAELFFDASSSNYSLPPNLEQINAAEKFIDYELDKAIKHIFESKSAKEPLKNENKITIFGVAGTITTICANALHLDKYDSKKIDKASLDLKQVFASCDELKIMNYEQLKALPFMHPGRIDSMAAGAVIYKRVLQRLQYEFSKYNIEIATTITSEKDILDGVALFSASKSPIS